MPEDTKIKRHNFPEPIFRIHFGPIYDDGHLDDLGVRKTPLYAQKPDFFNSSKKLL
jgi:hypothetical protein